MTTNSSSSIQNRQKPLPPLPDMSSPHHGPRGLGICHTPLNPREALALSPLNFCGMPQVRSAPKRSATLGVLGTEAMMRSGGRPMPAFSRAVSSNASSVPINQNLNARNHHIRSATWQSVASVADHGSTGYAHASSRRPTHRPKQVVHHDYYTVNVTDSWPQYPGRQRSTPIRYPSPATPPGPSRSPPSRIVELEGSPPAMTTLRFQQANELRSASSRAEPSQHSVEAINFRPSNADSMVIKRKPVGSGISPKKQTVEPACVSPSRGAGHMDARQATIVSISAGTTQTNGSKRLSAAWETSPDAFIPDDLWSKSGPQTNRADGSPQRPVEKRGRAKPCVRFAGRSDSHSSMSSAEVGAMDRDGEQWASAKWDSSPKRKEQPIQQFSPPMQSNDGSVIHPPDPSLDLTLTAQSLTNLAIATWDHINTEVLSNHYSRQQFKEYALHTLKFILLLYVASSLWNILSGIKDGLVRALQPVVMLWSFVRWLVAAGW